MSRIGNDTNLAYKISEDRSKLRSYSARGVISNVKWGISGQSPEILNPSATSFNHVNGISNAPYIPILFNTVGNVAVHSSTSEIMSNLDSCAKSFIPDTFSDEVITSLNENRFQLDTDGEGFLCQNQALSNLSMVIYPLIFYIN